MVIIGFSVSDCGKSQNRTNTDEWARIKLNDSRYSVKMPSKPHYSRQYFEFPAGLAESDEYVAVDGDLFYYAGYSVQGQIRIAFSTSLRLSS
jgi:hypothetical protein